MGVGVQVPPRTQLLSYPDRKLAPKSAGADFLYLLVSIGRRGDVLSLSYGGDGTVSRIPRHPLIVIRRSALVLPSALDVSLSRWRSRSVVVTCTNYWFGECTVRDVDVSVTNLRAHLSDWLDRARAGGEVVITDRGIPVARLTAVDSTGALERLTAEGVIGKATAPRPVASGRPRPRPRRPVSDRVSDQRR
jgi:prevent-host-death family protein